MDIHEIARLEISRVVDIHIPIDFGRLIGRTALGLSMPLAILDDFLDEDLRIRINEAFIVFFRNPGLDRHQLMVAVFLHLFIDLICHARRRRTILRGECKGPHIVEFDLSNEVTELLKISLCLSRESDHERRADGHARSGSAELAKKSIDALRGIAAVHTSEHGIADMLQRDIHVLADLIFVQDDVQEFIIKVCRIEIEKTDPLHTLDLDELTKEACEIRPEVASVAGKILRDEVEFTHPFSRQTSHFMDDGRDRAASHRPAYIGDVAERTAIAAAFSDLHIGGIFGRQRGTRDQLFIRAGNGAEFKHLFSAIGIGFIHGIQNILPGVCTDENIDFRDLLRKRFLVLL